MGLGIEVEAGVVSEGGRGGRGNGRGNQHQSQQRGQNGGFWQWSARPA